MNNTLVESLKQSHLHEFCITKFFRYLKCVQVFVKRSQYKIPFISNLKKPACASKRDVLELTTLRQLFEITQQRQNKFRVLSDFCGLLRISELYLLTSSGTHISQFCTRNTFDLPLGKQRVFFASRFAVDELRHVFSNVSYSIAAI